MRYFKLRVVHKIERSPSVACRSMKDVLADVELYGSDLGAPSSAEYMFNKAEDIDMDAFHDRYINRLDLGCSSDAPTFFDKLGDRFGFACRKENEPSPAPSPAPVGDLPE